MAANDILIFQRKADNSAYEQSVLASSASKVIGTDANGRLALVTPSAGGSNEFVFTLYNTYHWRSGESIWENSPCCIPHGARVLSDDWTDVIVVPNTAKYYCLSAGTHYAGAISDGSADGAHLANYAYNDGRTDYYWASSYTAANQSGNAYIGHDFGANNAKHIRSIRLRQYPDAGNAVTSVKVQHSDNGTSWTDVSTHTVTTGVQFLELAATAAHRYWRLLANSNLSTGWYWCVKQIQMSEWPAFGLDTGNWTANTWYYLYLIKNGSGTVRHLWSTSQTAPTMPSGYTLKRLVSCMYYSSGSSMAGMWWSQFGKRIQYQSTVTAVSGVTVTSYTSISLAGIVPPNIAVMATIEANSSYTGYSSNWAILKVSSDAWQANLLATSFYWSSNGDSGIDLGNTSELTLLDRVIPQIWAGYDGVTGGYGTISVKGFTLE